MVNTEKLPLYYLDFNQYIYLIIDIFILNGLSRIYINCVC